MKKVLVVVPNGHASKWLQICINSLKKYKNETEFDILVMNTWPGHPSLRAVTETTLGDGLIIKDCVRRKHSHATALDEAIEYAEGKEYTYMLAVETDATAMRDGWVDWFVSFMENPKVGVAGFFWHEGNNHYNINPSGTIYRMDMLQKYHKEVRENNSPVFWHPKGNKHDTDGGMDPSIKDVAGAFSETRGIENPTAAQIDVIMKGIPQASWFEPGAWLYARMQGEWEEVRVPCDHIYMQYPGHTVPEGTYYGGKENSYYTHHWGGTRCWDCLKHPISCTFVKSCAPMWMAREDKIWKETVPEEYRQKVYEVNKDSNVEELMRVNLGIVVPEGL